MSRDEPRIAVVVCTLDRPLGVTMLLDAIDRQALGAWSDRAVTVVVVDNSAAGSARSLCAARAEEGRFRLVYEHEPRRGLSFARNAGLAAARDAGVGFVAFIDDDEAPDPGWLSALHGGLDQGAAAAAVGPIRPIFDRLPPRWAIAGGFFGKTLAEREGALDDAYTCNVMIDLAVVIRHRLTFEQRFNSTGGEDTVFFKSLRDAGERIVWVGDAVVHEYMPAARTKPIWLMKRWFRTGGTEAELAGCGNGSIASRGFNAARGAVRIVGGSARGLLCLVAAPHRTERLMQALYTVCRGAGLIAAAAGRTYAEYGASTYR